MSNCVFVLAGQCGNQLGYSLLDEIYSNLAPTSEEENHLETYFRPYRSSKHQIARAVCLDTEPKVINECMLKAEQNGKWQYSKKSVAYCHGGAGNNWALGYDLASGEYLETSLNCIRRELEYCDNAQTLVLMHSVAGGTGSGLGTRITEECQDYFPEATRLNIAITPYHFGEVVVQHYNTLLCLSKISNASHGVITFENETAKLICQTMRSINRPTLHDINATIVSNLIPVFLPKVVTQHRNNYYCHSRFQQANNVNECNTQQTNSTQQKSNSRQQHGPAGRISNAHNNSTRTQRYKQYSNLIDDVTQLCSHPGYRFLDVKTTPQTSSKSVAYTYDSWFALLKTIQAMQLSGAASERFIKTQLKTSHHYIATGSSSPSGGFSGISGGISGGIGGAVLSGGRERGGGGSGGGSSSVRSNILSAISEANAMSKEHDDSSVDVMHRNNYTSPEQHNNVRRVLGISPRSSNRHQQSILSPPQQPAVSGDTTLIRSLASVITLYGGDAAQTAHEVYGNYTQHAVHNDNDDDDGHTCDESDFVEEADENGYYRCGVIIKARNSKGNGSSSSNNRHHHQQQQQRGPNQTQSSSGSVHRQSVSRSNAQQYTNRDDASVGTDSRYSTQSRQSNFTRTTASSRIHSQTHTLQANKQELALSADYINAHSDLFYGSMRQQPIAIHHSEFTPNQYARSCSVLSNNNSILPLLQKTHRQASEHFAIKAYLHQYCNFGVETGDFVDAFHNVGTVINNYMDL